MWFAPARYRYLCPERSQFFFEVIVFGADGQSAKYTHLVLLLFLSRILLYTTISKPLITCVAKVCMINIGPTILLLFSKTGTQGFNVFCTFDRLATAQAVTFRHRVLVPGWRELWRNAGVWAGAAGRQDTKPTRNKFPVRVGKRTWFWSWCHFANWKNVVEKCKWMDWCDRKTGHIAYSKSIPCLKGK